MEMRRNFMETHQFGHALVSGPEVKKDVEPEWHAEEVQIEDG